MDGKMSLGVLCACAGLAACGGDGGGGVVVPIVPTIGLLDSALPFGATNGNPQDMLSTDRTNGVANNLATITFNTDGTFSINLPGGGAPITVTNAAVITDGPAFDGQLRTTSATLEFGDYIVNMHLGETDLGSDLFILSRIEDAIAPENLAFTVIGDETASAALPTGNGVAYTGGFVSDVMDATGALVSQLSGTSTITADFADNEVDVVLNQTGDVTNATLSALNIPITGAQYSGAITSTGGVTAYSGTILGAFYGPNAEGTAGVFNAVDPVGAGAGDDLEIIGGFTGRQ